ncbi:MAG: RES family NAD+ phosphorylase [Firmicutes bacterium]|nr:RES family NAD+ phosphorylase [Bacillota bacterium]
MLTTLSERLVRLAFPLQSVGFKTLGQSDEERLAAEIVLRHTTPPSAGARDYVDRPFQFPSASRFSDGSYGMLYAADSIPTAVRETSYHLTLTYANDGAPPMETRLTHLALRIEGHAGDIRRAVDATVPAGVYDPNDYTASQAFGAQIRSSAEAVHYDSVRNTHNGRCVGTFTPTIVHGARIVGQTALVWNGTRFIEDHAIRPL